MHLTRTGFNAIVALYLFPLVIIDFIGNSTTTGSTSDYYLYKAVVDGLLFAYACYWLFQEPTAHVDSARARANNPGDTEVIGFENIGAIEYIYCGALCLYALGNAYFLHDVNKNSTGLMSMVSLVWFLLSLAVGIMAAIQFWHLKSGTIVQLKRKVIQ